MLVVEMNSLLTLLQVAFFGADHLFCFTNHLITIHTTNFLVTRKDGLNMMHLIRYLSVR